MPLGALLGPSWEPPGALLGALTKNVGADGAVFNMISSANKKVSETVAPRGPFFPSKIANNNIFIAEENLFDLNALKLGYLLKDERALGCSLALFLIIRQLVFYHSIRIKAL